MYPKTLWRILKQPVRQIGELWWDFWTINSIKALLVGLAISWRHEKLGHGTCRWEKRLPWHHSGCLVTEAKTNYRNMRQQEICQTWGKLASLWAHEQGQFCFCWVCDTPQTYGNPRCWVRAALDEHGCKAKSCDNKTPHLWHETWNAGCYRSLVSRTMIYIAWGSIASYMNEITVVFDDCSIRVGVKDIRIKSWCKKPTKGIVGSTTRHAWNKLPSLTGDRADFWTVNNSQKWGFRVKRN